MISLSLAKQFSSNSTLMWLFTVSPHVSFLTSSTCYNSKLVRPKTYESILHIQLEPFLLLISCTFNLGEFYTNNQNLFTSNEALLQVTT